MNTIQRAILLRVTNVLSLLLIGIGAMLLQHYFGTDVALYVLIGSALLLVIGYRVWRGRQHGG